MKQFEQYLQNALAEGKAIGAYGCAAAACGCKKEVFAEAFVGEAPLPGDVPVTRHTKFDMASISKILSPTMIAFRAMEDGQLSTEETIGDFFPDAPKDKRDITVEMLMTHTSGMPAHFHLEEDDPDPDNALQTLLNHPLANEPGKVAVYSCMGYITFGKMLEKRFGKSLDVLAKERVFNPLGMTETTYCPKDKDNCAATEIDPKTGKPLIGVVHDENARFIHGISANAGVFMPLEDGEKFMGMLACWGDGYLKEETLRNAIINRTPGQEEHRGLGFKLAGTEDCFFSDRVPDETFGHTGYTGTSFMVEPETGFWVLILSNRVYPTRENTKLFPWRRKTNGDLWEMFKN